MTAVNVNMSLPPSMGTNNPNSPNTPNNNMTPPPEGRSEPTSRSVVYLWDSKLQQVVCALRSRLAASGLTSMPRQSTVPEASTLRQRIMGLNPPTNPVEQQDFLNMTQALQQQTNVLNLPEVCHDFFERAGCPIAGVTAYGNGSGQAKDRIGRRVAGTKCHRVHVIGVDHTWRIILPSVHQQSPTAPPRYGSGFAVQCYNSSRTQYYKIPSTFISVTAGSEAFVDRFNVEGRHFHGEPFIACSDYAMSCVSPIHCPHGSQCQYIHINIPTNPQMLHHALNDLAVVEQSDHVRRDPNFLMREVEQALQSVRCPQSALQAAHRVLDVVFGGTPSHIAADDVRSRYPRIGCNFVVRVYAPNFSADAETDYASEQVLVTAGSLRYRNQMLSQRTDVSLTSQAVEFYMGASTAQPQQTFPVLYPHPNIQKIQHCAHFKNKGICRNGQNCKFIHIIDARPATSQPPMAAMTGGLPQFHANAMTGGAMPMPTMYAPMTALPGAGATPAYMPNPQMQPQQFLQQPQHNGFVAQQIPNHGVLQTPPFFQQPQQMGFGMPAAGPFPSPPMQDALALGQNSQRVVVRTRNPARPYN